MATLTKSLDELDENARLMSEQQHQQPPRRQTSDGPASFSANAATLRSKASPKRYIDYSYQQNFGMGLGSTAREPGSIPLLLSTGKQQDCSSSSGNSSDEPAPVWRAHRKEPARHAWAAMERLNIFCGERGRLGTVN